MSQPDIDMNKVEALFNRMLKYFRFVVMSPEEFNEHAAKIRDPKTGQQLIPTEDLATIYDHVNEILTPVITSRNPLFATREFIPPNQQDRLIFMPKDMGLPESSTIIVELAISSDGSLSLMVPIQGSTFNKDDAIAIRIDLETPDTQKIASYGGVMTTMDWVSKKENNLAESRAKFQEPTDSSFFDNYEYVDNILYALQYMHEKKYVLGGVSPANFLLGRNTDGELFSKLAGNPMPISNSMFLTAAQFPNPLAPELLKPDFTFFASKPDVYALDVYALGVSLFMLFTGHTPEFNRSVHTEDDEYTEKVLKANPFLAQLLAEDPKDRPSAKAALAMWQNLPVKFNPVPHYIDRYKVLAEERRGAILARRSSRADVYKQLVTDAAKDVKDAGSVLLSSAAQAAGSSVRRLSAAMRPTPFSQEEFKKLCDKANTALGRRNMILEAEYAKDEEGKGTIGAKGESAPSQTATELADEAARLPLVHREFVRIFEKFGIIDQLRAVNRSKLSEDDQKALDGYIREYESSKKLQNATPKTKGPHKG